MFINKAYTSLPLTNFSLGYFQSADAFIATKIFPLFPVKKRTGDIYSYGKDALRIVDTKRAIGWAYNKINLEVSKTSFYRLDDYGLSADVLQEDLDFAEAPIDAEIDTTETLTQKLMLDMEQKLSDVVTDPAVITQNTQLSWGAKWNVYTTSTPLEDFQTARADVFNNSTKEPNTLIIGWNVLQALIDHPDIRSQFPGAVQITHNMVKDKLGAILWFDNVLVGKAKRNNSNLNAASQPFANIWGDIAIVAYIETSPRIKTRTLWRTFSNKSARNVERYPVSQLGEEAIRRKVYSMIMVNMYYDQVLVDATCAHLIYDIL